MNNSCMIVGACIHVCDACLSVCISACVSVCVVCMDAWVLVCNSSICVHAYECACMCVCSMCMHVGMYVGVQAHVYACEGLRKISSCFFCCCLS